MKVICTKFEAASRQLDEAIALLFADHDPLAVRTLAAAAHGLLADLVEHNQPNGSWRSHLIDTSGLSRKEALEVINSAQNFLKHADRDPDAHLRFEEEENEHIIFIATLECGELGGPLTTAMQAFQIWYLARYPDKIGAESELVIKSRSAFPGLNEQTREGQLAAGLNFLTSAIAAFGTGSLTKKKPKP
ncbi:hypothetical protein PS903_02489 [Pseudomonas fluorescens]|nr:hypothetical protein PS903_02489 [Pseudomonas fluorescens]